MSEPQKGSRPYIFRGLAYSITSIMVLFSGYFMNNTFYRPETLLLCIPIGLVAVFFVTYAVCFDYDYAELGPPYEYAKVAHREAIQFTAALVVAVVVISVLFYIILKGPLPTDRFIFYIILNAFLYISYSTFLYKRYRLAGVPRIRHWLFWPVIIAIAVSLYYGRYFSLVSSSLKPHFPVLVLFSFFLVAEIIKFRQKQFLIGSVAFLLLLIALTIMRGLFGLDLPEIFGTYFPAMLFCIIMAAYLAVFESWRMTSFIASRESARHEPVSAETGLAESSPHSERTMRYYSATLVAHTLAVCFIPLAYIFSDYNLVFIAGFTVHAILSFAFWLVRGKDQEGLSTKNWAWPKILFGGAFLVIMVAGVRSKVDLPFDTRVVSPILNKLWWVMGAVSGWLAKLVYQEYNKLEDSEFWSRIIALFSNRLNVIRLVAISTFVACSVILFLQDLPRLAPYMVKTQEAYLSYFILFVCCCLVEIFNLTKLHKVASAVGSVIFGVIQTIRVPPSLLIGLAVFLPGLSVGASIQTSLGGAVAFCLIAMAGFALNDYFDVSKDIVNKPHRPIPSGRLRRRDVMFIAILLLLLSLCTSWLVVDSRFSILVFSVSVLSVLGYNLVVKCLGFTKSFYTAACSGLPFLYDVVLYNLPRAYLLVPISAILFVSARELLMDIRDIAGDQQSGVRTVPMLIGTARTANLAFLLKATSLLTLLPFVFAEYVSGHSLAKFGLWLAMIISVFAMYRLWWTRSGVYQRRIVLCLWATMFLGILLVVV